MPFDAAMTAAVAEDLRTHLIGGRVDKVIQTGDLAIGVLFRAEFTNQWLVLSAQAQQARVQRTQQRQSSASAEPSSYVMLLRKYLEGARLQAVAQQGVDRVLRLTFRGAEWETALIAEVMGKYSNVILADERLVVLGALKHVHAGENRVRVTLPHHPYVGPPPPMQPPPHDERPKLDPLHTLAGDIALALAQLDPAAILWRSLLDLVDGLSPTLAREVACAVAGAVDAPVGPHCDLDAARTMLALIRERFGPGRGPPSALWRGEKLVEFAPYPLRQYGEEPELYPDLQALLDAVYGAARASDPLAGQRAPLLGQIEALRKAQRRKIASLESSMTPADELARLRQSGEMVLAYQHAIAPGQRELALPELGLSIPLDPALSALENAQRLFKRYGKARDAAAVVPALLEAARHELAYLDDLAVHASQAADPVSLAAVREDLREAGSTPEQAAARGKRQDARGRAGKGVRPRPGISPLRVKAADGTEILVGRSARQNDALTFGLAGPQDLWLHARQIPGAHVILRSGGRPPSQQTLLQAAGLAAYYSQARGSTTVPVDYTLVRNVRRIKGARPGLVHYSGETTLNVRPGS